MSAVDSTNGRQLVLHGFVFFFGLHLSFTVHYEILRASVSNLRVTRGLRRLELAQRALARCYQTYFVFAFFNMAFVACTFVKPLITLPTSPDLSSREAMFAPTISPV